MRRAALICMVAVHALVAGLLFAPATQRTAAVTQRFPLIYWPERIDTAAALKQAGIEQIAAPPEKAEAWQKAGLRIVPLSQAELERREKLLVPRTAGRANVASATRRPWIDANGWRFVRHPTREFYYDLPTGKAPLAFAEAFAHKADAILKIDPADLAEVGKLVAFIKRMPGEVYPTIADIGVIDDGSPTVGEVMNLLARRNLLFQIVSSPAQQFRVNIKLGSKEHSEADAADPSAFAQRIRRQLGDENRTLRIYGSELVIAHLTGNNTGARLHLLNYSGVEIEGLRVRLRGRYERLNVYGFGYAGLSPEDIGKDDYAIELTIPKIGMYAVVDLYNQALRP